ncbi:MAG: hypothetical protein IPF47_11740 [Gemmatimonadetes bacterium]|nr:hypothetical protein [Gemmatimonadota bacterium]
MTPLVRAALIAAAVIAPAVSAVPSQAQGASALVGAWTLSYERGRRVENGVVSPIMGESKFEVAQSGDSLLATLAPGARPDGTIPPPATFGGRIAGDSAVFVQKQKATFNMNGEETTRDIFLTWVLRASGDALTGTMAREMPGMEAAGDMMAPSPVKGVRVKR